MKQGSRFKRRRLWGAPALGVLFLVSSCMDIPAAPSRSTTGSPVSETPASPAQGGAADPAPAPAPVTIASLLVSPASVEISAPHYTDEDEKPDQASPASDGSNLEHESAGFPTSAFLNVTFRTASGQQAPPQDLLWTTSNSQLLAVDEYGWVQAIDPEVAGTATVTARLRSNPQVSATATVTVRNDGVIAIELN